MTVSRSRVHRAYALLGDLRRLATKLELAYALAQLPDEQKWIRQTADAIDKQIFIGESVLEGMADPRQWRTVKKRQPTLL
jgi:hypothetical protein